MSGRLCCVGLDLLVLGNGDGDESELDGWMGWDGGVELSGLEFGVLLAIVLSDLLGLWLLIGLEVVLGVVSWLLLIVMF